MRYLIFAFLSLFLVSCNIPLPKGGGGSDNNPGGNTGVGDTDPTPTATPTPDDPTVKPFRPCVVVEEFKFDSTIDKNVWKPSYYYTAPEKYPLSFEDDGIHFKGGSGYRSGVTIDLGDRDVSGCPSLAFRVQGTIVQQTLGGAGMDNREAPLAVMIQYTDSKGVRHSSLNAFNEGESDDNATTRMYWWGFGYLNPEYNFGYGFTPNLTAVEQNVKFDKVSGDLRSLDISLDIKIIHTITLEASGWALESVLHQFAMKPLEAFADPDAPYRDGPPTGSKPIGVVTNASIQGEWVAANPAMPECKRYILFFNDDQFDYRQECDPFTNNSYTFRYGSYTMSGNLILFVSDGKDGGLASTFIFGNDMFGLADAVMFPNGQLKLEDAATREVVVFDKQINHP